MHACNRCLPLRSHPTMSPGSFWMSPEVVEMAGATSASDVWSVGATVLELVSGKPPYFDLPPMAALFHIVQDETVPLPDGLSPALREFLSECFRKEPSFRKTAALLLEHPWIVTNVRVSSRARLAAAAASAGRTSLGSGVGGRWAVGGPGSAAAALNPDASEPDPVAVPEPAPRSARARRRVADARPTNDTASGSSDLLLRDWDEEDADFAIDTPPPSFSAGVVGPATAAEFAALSDATIVTTQRLLQLPLGGGGRVGPGLSAAPLRIVPARHAPIRIGSVTAEETKLASPAATDPDADWDADDAVAGAVAIPKAASGASREGMLVAAAAADGDEDDWDAPAVDRPVAPAPPPPAAGPVAAPPPRARALAALDARAVASAFDDDDAADPGAVCLPHQSRPSGRLPRGLRSPTAGGGGGSRPLPLSSFVDADDIEGPASQGAAAAMRRPPVAVRSGKPVGQQPLRDALQQQQTEATSWENAVQLPLVAATGGMGVADLRARLAAKRTGSSTASPAVGAPLSPSSADAAAAADPFAQFDEADFTADPRAESLRAAQRELTRLSARLEPACALAAPVSIRPVCRALISRFAAEPQLRAFFVRSHGVLPLLELLQVRARGAPAAIPASL